MPKNMGTIDKVIRVLVALAAAGVIYMKPLHGTLAIVIAAVAVIFILTSLIGFCPLYWPFGISTKKKDKDGPCCSTTGGCC